MVCIPARKILFLGSKLVQDLFLSDMQRLGIGEFVLGETDPKWIEVYTTIVKAIDTLSVYGPLLDNRVDVFLHEDLDIALTCAYAALARQEGIEVRQQVKGGLLQELQSVFPFGTFSFDELQTLTHALHAQVMFLKASLEQIDAKNLPFDFCEICRQGGMWYGISFGYSHPEKPFEKLEIKSEASSVQHQLSLLELEETEDKKHLLYLAQEYGPLLLSAKRFLNNWIAYLAVKESMQKEGGAFHVLAWVDPNYMHHIDELATKYTLYWEEQELINGEIPPTILRNEGCSRMGQDLVEIYDTPSTSDKDPSLWVLGSFALFFAMIMGDMGYGLIILFSSLYLEKDAVSKSLEFVRFVRVGKILGMTTALWGLLIGSFFGWNLPSKPYSLPYQLASAKITYHRSVQDQAWKSWSATFPGWEKHIEAGLPLMTYLGESADQNEMFKIPEDVIDSVNKEFSLLVGIVHLMISMIRGSYRSRTVWGWICFLLGGYIYLSNFLNAVILPHYLFYCSSDMLLTLGTWVMCFGFIFAHVCALVERGWISGLLEWTNAIQLFSDVLSYLRIYALALSGSIIASTFNEIASTMPLPFAIVCGFIGHTINFILGVMGATVHGLRLNFLEWYRYSFEGGGRKFRPFFWR